MKHTILYARLSRDDELQGDSNSILNQKMVLEAYARNNRLERFQHIFDDGFSGTTFDRPGFIKMMDMVDAGQVGIIIVKDMSRLGRDYLRVGLIMEKLHEQRVRLIAINDNVDTDGGREDDFTVFRNVINEWYARDTSRKIRAIFRAKALEGKRISPSTPYGYIRDTGNRQQWVVDEQAAEVVRRIYRMVIAGYGITHIARTLGEEKILNPSSHEEQNGSDMRHRHSDPYRWSTSAIARILERQEYLGHTISMKSTKDSYKSKKRKQTPAEDRLVFMNTHPAIIDEETWHNAQRLRRTRRRRLSHEIMSNRLTGLVFCVDCGRKMTYNGASAGPKRAAHNEYVCDNFRKEQTCSLHFIRVAVLEQRIHSAIMSACNYVRANEEDFVRRVKDAFEHKQTITEAECRQQIKAAERRRSDLQTIIKRLLEANAHGIVSDTRFNALFADYITEQELMDTAIKDMKMQIEQLKADRVRADKFIDLVNRYRDSVHAEQADISTEMINEFVEKVMVHEGDRSSGKRMQTVDVHLNYIGLLAIPDDPDNTAHARAGATDATEERKARRRAITQRYRERKAAGRS